MRDITYAASLVSDEPLDGERYFAGLTSLRAWLDSEEAPFSGYRRLYTLSSPIGTRSVSASTPISWSDSAGASTPCTPGCGWS